MLQRFSYQRLLSLSVALCLMAFLFMAELQGWTAYRVAPPWDKLIHASVYGFLSGLLGWGMVTYHRFWRLLVLMAILGMAHEWFQSYLPGRMSSVWDWLADVCGSSMVLFLLALSKRKEDSTQGQLYQSP